MATNSSVGGEGWYIDDVLVLGTGPTGTAVALTPEPEGGEESAGLVLLGNTPNPFNPRTTIRYRLPSDGAVTLAVFDIEGRRVGTLASGARAAGWHEVAWDGRDADGRVLGPGIYFARLEAGDRTVVTRMVMIR